MTSRNNTLERVRDACQRVTGERYCSTCQQHRRLSDGPGMSKVTGKGRTVTRWMCQVCVERKGLK